MLGGGRVIYYPGPTPQITCSQPHESCQPQTWVIRCMADASPFAITAIQEAFCCNQSELAYIQVCTNTDFSCPEVPLGGTTLVCSERGYPNSSIKCFCFSSCPWKISWCWQLVQDDLCFITAFNNNNNNKWSK